VTERIDSLIDHTNPYVSAAARQIVAKNSDRQGGREHDTGATWIPLVDKILHLEKIDLFAGLPINELAAVAAMTDVLSAEKGKTIFREGERGDVLYLLLSSELSVVKNCNSDEQVELDRVDVGEPVGEMALFGDHVRSSTIHVTGPSQLLCLYEQQFKKIVREHPQVGLHACRVLSRRLRRLHAKISDLHY
jgi:CRP-like cAMP-binding protein